MDIPDQEKDAMRLRQELFISGSPCTDDFESTDKDVTTSLFESKDLNPESPAEISRPAKERRLDNRRNNDDDSSDMDASNFEQETSRKMSNPPYQEDHHSLVHPGPTCDDASSKSNLNAESKGDSLATVDTNARSEHQLNSEEEMSAETPLLSGIDRELLENSNHQTAQLKVGSSNGDQSRQHITEVKNLSNGSKNPDAATSERNHDVKQVSHEKEETSATASDDNEADRLRFRKKPFDSDEKSSSSTVEDTNPKIYNDTKDENTPGQRLIYGLTDTPPLHYLFFFAIQQACLAISTPLGTTAIVAQAVCAKDDLELKVRILSSTMAMMGLSTFLMTTVGVKLPIFQGPSPGYIIPLIVLMFLPEFECPETFWANDPNSNTSVLMAVVSGNDKGTSPGILKPASNVSEDAQDAVKMTSLLASETVAVPNRDVALNRLQAYAGSLMVAGTLHFLIGLTGVMGTLVRYVGPVTIVPVVLLFGIYIHTVVVMFSETNWIVAVITAATCIVLGLFLSDRKTPFPVWTPGKGARVIWTSAHQIFAILIALVLGWGVSFIMTMSGALSDDPNSVQFTARTDARNQVIAQTSWFILPYPGQFGAPSFSGTALLTFLIGTVISILDSMGDYYATARAAKAPPPPSYALNRGVAVEGAMSILSGGFGCGQATVSYSENIGAIGLSRVASRSVFQIVGVIYMFLAVVGKVGAIFVSIPDAVIGGSQIVTFGILIGVILSYLQLVDLQRTRNVSIIGIAILLGMMLPHWVKKSGNSSIDTGSPAVDNALTVCLSNPSLVGGVFAFFLDNLIPGTLRERGIPEPEAKPQTAEKILDEKCVENQENFAERETHHKTSVDNSGATVCDDIQILVDEKENKYDDRYDVGVDVYRINWIPNFLREGLFARLFPIFDKKLL